MSSKEQNTPNQQDPEVLNAEQAEQQNQQDASESIDPRDERIAELEKSAGGITRWRA